MLAESNGQSLWAVIPAWIAAVAAWAGVAFAWWQARKAKASAEVANDQKNAIEDIAKSQRQLAEQSNPRISLTQAENPKTLGYRRAGFQVDRSYKLNGGRLTNSGQIPISLDPPVIKGVKTADGGLVECFEATDSPHYRVCPPGHTGGPETIAPQKAAILAPGASVWLDITAKVTQESANVSGDIIVELPCTPTLSDGCERFVVRVPFDPR